MVDTARAQRDGRAPSLVAGVVRDGGLAWSAERRLLPSAEAFRQHVIAQARAQHLPQTPTPSR